MVPLLAQLFYYSYGRSVYGANLYANCLLDASLNSGTNGVPQTQDDVTSYAQQQCGGSTPPIRPNLILVRIIPWSILSGHCCVTMMWASILLRNNFYPIISWFALLLYYNVGLHSIYVCGWVWTHAIYHFWLEWEITEVLEFFKAILHQKCYTHMPCCLLRQNEREARRSASRC